LRLIFLNYKRFIKTRQLFSLQLVHSIAARTVMATGLPPHLRSERVLAEHFENMKLSVESVSICREISSLERLIEARTRALLKLEEAWVRYVGNPSTVETYDPSDHAIIGDGDPASTEAQVPNRFVVPHHRRPTIRPGWFSGRVDAIELLEKRFLEADEAVKRHRRTGRFKPMDVGFITFEKMSSAVRHFLTFDVKMWLIMTVANCRPDRAYIYTISAGDPPCARAS
jgi:calcium permeable stress-gated cation channel